MTNDKLVLQTSEEPVELVQEPHFDEEATLAAKRVVPLGTAPSVELRASRSGNWPVLTLVLVVVAAGAVGLISGMSIAGYRFIKQSAPAAVQSEQVNDNDPAIVAQSENGPSITPTPQQVESRNVPPKTEQAVVITKIGQRAEAASKSEPAPGLQPQTERPKRNEAEAKKHGTHPQSHERDVAKKDMPDESPNTIATPPESTEVRIERRRRVHDENNPEIDPRSVQRAQRRIDRIRDIFMGPPQD